jgi:hypothetical protein
MRVLPLIVNCPVTTNEQVGFDRVGYPSVKVNVPLETVPDTVPWPETLPRKGPFSSANWLDPVTLSPV